MKNKIRDFYLKYIKGMHDSDCATNSEPYLPAGKCDCK